MTRKLLFILLFLFTLNASAQTKWLKKARKAQLNLVSYDANGQLLHSTNGFLIDEEGTVLSDYASFKGAARAVAIDEKGTEYPILTVAGASSLYDVIKLRADIRKGQPLPLATINGLKGQDVFVLPYLTSKSGLPTATTIEDAKTFKELYSYYTLPVKLTERSTSCPVVNSEGEVIGLVQMTAKADEEKSYAISATYVNELQITAINANSADYRDILIRKELPSDASQAASFIYLIGTRDTALYLGYVNDYIRRFPSEASGYTMLGEMLAAQGKFAEADAAWEAGNKAGAAQPELDYSHSRSILAAIQNGNQLPETWTLEHSMELAQQAEKADPQPIYSALQGHILYAQKRYAEASEKFVSVNQTKLRSAEHFLYAAQCQQMLADTTAMLALQDSAVACFTKPYTSEAAPALLMRATTLRSIGRYRDAIKDLNEYEHLMSASLNANFYYQRYQTEMQCRMFQQALSDIERATLLEPDEPLYFAELAGTHFRFNQLDEAIVAARKAIALNDDFADAHRILGICLRAQQKETEARAALQRAVELGDDIAKDIINKQ